MIQRPWDRENDADKRDDNGEDDGARGVIRECVEDLGTSKDVETNEENVVGEQHEPGELVSKLAFAEGVVAKVTDVLDLGILHDEFPHRVGRNPEERPRNKHGNDPWDPTENHQRPGLSHDSQADLVSKQQGRRFLPRHSS